MRRRGFLTGLALVTASGCLTDAASDQPAHTVSVYHVDHDETAINVTVTVENADEGELFHKEYSLSETNESDEDATFQGSAEPETVSVEIDGNRFERNWPGFEQPGLPCEGENRAGVELWIERGQDKEPSLRMETNCQYVTSDENAAE